MTTKCVSTFVFAMILTVASSGALSASIIASASASWAGATCTPLPNFQCAPPEILLGDSATATGINVAVRVSLPDPGVGGAFGSASAQYGFVVAQGGGNSGVLGWDSVPFFLSPLEVGFARGEASASFSDTITIFGGVGSGMLAVDIGVDCLEFDEGRTFANLYVGTAHQFCFGLYHQYDLQTAFTFGVPLDIRGDVTASGSDPAPWDANNGASDGSATARLSRLIVSDANGQRLRGFTYSSASAARYDFQDAVFIPEPSTAGMVVLSLFFGIAIWKIHPRHGAGAVPSV